MHRKDIATAMNNYMSDVIYTLSRIDDLHKLYKEKMDEAKHSINMLAKVQEYIHKSKRLPFTTWLSVARTDNGSLLTQTDPFLATTIIEQIVIPDSKTHVDDDGIKISVDGVRLLLRTKTDKIVANGIVEHENISIPRPDVLHVLYAEKSEKTEKILKNLTEYGFSLVAY